MIDRSFSYYAPINLLWNSLPKYFHQPAAHSTTDTNNLPILALTASQFHSKTVDQEFFTFGEVDLHDTRLQGLV